MGISEMYFWASGVLFVVLVLLMIFFAIREAIKFPEESRLARITVALVSWPARFRAYESGHGRHAYA